MWWQTLTTYVAAVTENAACGSDTTGPIDTSSLPQACAGTTELHTILQIVFGVIGALTLLFVTISGFRYITSAGNPQQAAQAKNALIYSLVGLAVSLTAEAIVTFIVGNL
ncbi:MAG TPA: pilin [Candidatus Saccharimonadales bacterium]|nr:pilin [Candidatus Saccharimonadales bacterium]